MLDRLRSEFDEQSSTARSMAPSPELVSVLDNMGKGIDKLAALDNEAAGLYFIMKRGM